MAYSSNMDKVLRKLEKDLKKIQNTGKVVQDIAVSLAASNTRRIHNEGQKVAGGAIGRYKPSTKRIRAKAGRQTSFVDLSFSGITSKEFVAEPVAGGWVVGFINPSGRKFNSSDIRKVQEERYGELWGISQSDENAIQRILKKEIRIG